jgi:hypothetical protein
VLDLADLGPRAHVGEVAEGLARKLGLTVPDKALPRTHTDWNAINEIEALISQVLTGDDETLPIFRLLRNQKIGLDFDTAQWKFSTVGSQIVDMAKRKGYDSIRYIHDTPKGPVAHYAVLTPYDANTRKMLPASRALNEAKKALMAGRTAPDAPELIKNLNIAEWGKPLSSKPIVREMQKKFGLGPSPLRSRELGFRHKIGLGAIEADIAKTHQIRKILDPLASRIAKQHGIKAKEARKIIGNVIDIGEDVSRYHPSSGAAAFLAEPRTRAIATDPEVVQFIKTYADDVGKIRAAEEAAGVTGGLVDDYFPRRFTKKAAKATREHERKFGATGKRGLERTRTVEAVGPQGKKLPMLETEWAGDLGEDLKAKGWTLPGEATPEGPRRWDTPALDMSRKAERVGMKHKMGPGVKGELFEMDPAGALGARAARGERQIAGAELRKFLDEFGVTITSKEATKMKMQGLRKVPGTVFGPDNPLRNIIGDEIANKAFPAPIADMIERLGASYAGGADTKALLKATDMTLGWFKRWALFHPAYVIRNIFQNAFGTMMSGMNPVRAAKWWASPKAHQLRKAVEDGSFRAAPWLDDTIKLGGKNVTMREIAEYVSSHNLVQGSVRSGAEFAPGPLREGGVMFQTARGAGGKARQFGEMVRHFNANVESSMKLGTWLAYVDEGLSFDDALMQAHKAMPDLSDITQWERAGLTRLFPWYRWMKNNGSLQLFHYLPQKPAYMASVKKFQHFLEGASQVWREEGEVPQELRPEWMREQQAAQVGGGPEQGSAFLLGSWFPFQEVQTAASALIEPAAAAKEIASIARPGAKAVVEYGAGRDIFRGRPVERKTTAETIQDIPKAFMGASGTPLDNLLAIRPLREYGRRVGEQPTLGGKISRGFLGGALQPLSREKGLQAIDIQTAQEIAKLKRQIIRAQENGDIVEAKALLAQFMQLQMYRRRLGLSIPKASEAQLGQAGLLR